MKAMYRGVEIESKREKCLGGWSEVYWSAYRKSDGYEIACGFGGGNVRECFKDMKDTVDRFIDEFGGDDNKYNNEMHGIAMLMGGIYKSINHEEGAQ